jgi:hypothetical protein
MELFVVCTVAIKDDKDFVTSDTNSVHFAVWLNILSWFCYS